MKLMTVAIQRALPKLYSTDGKPAAERKVVAKFFAPWSNWTWYVLEGDPQPDGDILFFGLVEGLDTELGYFSLKELAAVKGRFGLGIERDLHWNPKTTLADVEGSIATRVAR